ncbi:MAG: glycerophosphodiester phosphodiesterase family protein [Bacteroidota bacterium]
MRYLLILACFLFMNRVSSQNNSQINSSNRTAIVAHRGGSLLAPENTLAAFNNAIQIGAAWIEIDVHQTSDKVTVVIHDNTLDRTTNGKGSVNKTSFEKLRSFDAGGKFSNRFVGEKVPTLDETLTLIAGKCNLLIEIKNPDASREIEKDVVSLIQKHQAWSWCVVQSFHYQSVLKVHQLDTQIKTALLFVKPNIEKVKNDAEMSFLSGINIYQRFAGKRTIEKLHSLHKTVFVWTVNDSKRIRKIVENGADGIMTDDPQMMKELLNR